MPRIFSAYEAHATINILTFEMFEIMYFFLFLHLYYRRYRHIILKFILQLLKSLFRRNHQ
jgi:hypothetical protein